MTLSDEEIALIAGSFAVACPVPLIRPGARLRSPGGKISKGEFIYLKGAPGTMAGSVVIYNPKSFMTSLLVSDDYGPVAVAASAAGLSHYGWYRIKGRALVKVGAVFPTGDVFASSTPGQVDGEAASGARVKNARFVLHADEPSPGFAKCEIHWPYMS